MSPRKTILRELAQTRDQTGGEAFTRPSTITGFDKNPADYQKAVNKLLGDRLIEGRTDEEGRITISVNDHRLAEVKKELRPVWAQPGIWLTAAVVLGTVFGLAV
jgi:hypothetical protein